jgi:polar amino acid transport system substrate-binding protein/glutamate/aspartate transport system substrate-binding protein
MRNALGRSRTGRLALGVVIALLTAMASATLTAATLERIRDRKTIVFAYRDGAAPFSFKDRDGRVRGYSVELCTRIAAAIERQLQLTGLNVEWVAVDADTRVEAVASGRADAECGTTTITLSRMERVDFSVPIFVDGGALAVGAHDSPVKRLADLNGRRVAVIRGTTTERALTSALGVADVKATVVHVAKPEEGAAAVRDGRADAYAGDRIVLTQIMLRSNDALAVLPEDFSFEPYAIVVRRDDPDFRLAVNRALVAIYKRGDIDAIFQRWLAPLGNPSALVNAMFYLNALPD